MKTIKEIALWLVATASGLVTIFGCFSDVDSDSFFVLAGTRLVGLFGMSIMVATLTRTELYKRMGGNSEDTINE